MGYQNQFNLTNFIYYYYLHKFIVMPARKQGKGRRVKPVTLNFVIDCTNPVQDGIMDSAHFEEFLSSKIKVNGKAGVLGDQVSISRDKTRVKVDAKAPFSKRYLKYLTKKYLKKQSIRDYLRVVSTDKQTYEIRYFNIQDDDESDVED